MRRILFCLTTCGGLWLLKSQHAHGKEQLQRRVSCHFQHHTPPPHDQWRSGGRLQLFLLLPRTAGEGRRNGSSRERRPRWLVRSSGLFRRYVGHFLHLIGHKLPLVVYAAIVKFMVCMRAEVHLQVGLLYLLYLLPLQLLDCLDQLALQGRKASRALLAPLAHQVPLAPQEERPMSAGGGQCAQVLLEQGWSIMALLQALTSQSEEEEPATSVQQQELTSSTRLKPPLPTVMILYCTAQSM